MSDDQSTDPALHSTLDTDLLHVQLNAYDFYMTKPGTLDTKHGNSLPMNEYLKVPVISIFGNLPTGHQVLCHIHGIFPYIFIPYDGRESDSTATMNQKCARLHTLLENWCQVSAAKKRKNSEKSNNKDTTSSNYLKYIANISVVKGVPFYGYHVGWSLFYKVSLLEVGFANRLNDGIRDGEIFGKQVDCYESQLPYLLQFTVDFNLFCCSWLDLRKCYFRTPLLNTTLELDKLFYTNELEQLMTQFCDLKSNVLSEKEYPRIGNGLLEIDVVPQFITNLEDLQFRELHHDFVELMKDTSDILCKPYVTSTRNIIKYIETQREALSLGNYTTASSIERVASPNKWQSSKVFDEEFQHAKHRLSSRDGKLPNLESFISDNHYFDKVKNPRQSLPELWPSLNLKVLESSSNDNSNIIDTLDHHYSAADLSDKEEANGEPLENYSQDNCIENVLSISEEIPGHNYKRPPTDKLMTQLMAKKIKSTRKVTSSNNKMSNRRHFRRGLKYAKESFVFKSCLVDSRTIMGELESQGYPKVDYLDPYFGNPLDLAERPYIYAGKRFEITSNHSYSRIPVPFEENNLIMSTEAQQQVFSSWKYLRKAPSYNEVMSISKQAQPNNKIHSHIDHPSSRNELYSKSSSKEGNLKININKAMIKDTLTHFSLEIHVQSAGPKLPDPQKDEVRMICWCLEKETYPFDLDISSEGIMVVKESEVEQEFANNIQQAAGKVPVAFYEDEFDMFDALVDLVLIFDPDILSGFELHNASWGYLLERSRKIHNFELTDELSRANHKSKNKRNDAWGFSHASGITIPGRHMINVWRALRSEINLTQYSVENLSYKLLQERLPHFSFKDLSEMWGNYKDLSKVRTVINYWLMRCRINISLLQKQEYIPRITEQARLTGIDFYSVYYRGSQYKIESILSRICKSESFLLLAPSRKQVKMQKALECVPLVMEPESAFYKSPMIVLDFQSLYPSVMIAHNYCYSTMIGRVRELKISNNEIGVSKFPLRRNILGLLENHISLAPNGVVFVDSSARKSTLAKMLEDILDTRVMVKKTMSNIGDRNTSLKRILNSKQLALKLISNVTYGYASASFSGRMPCSDLADSIVQTGREILEKAIDLIEANTKWGAKVVYGDTDSLFIYLPGKTRSEAFIIGQEMAESVTRCNPDPISLNFEKVYHPCLLLSKKRYVGFKYEKSSKSLPSFDAKGIETVRRDGHPAQQKITEKCLRILFETKDLSRVKQYVQQEFSKIHRGRVQVQDFCFAKEVRLGTYKSEKTAPPGAHVASRQIENDHRAKPQYRERVPYVVIRGPQGMLLRDRCLSLEEFLSDESFELDSEYYISKTLVPPLERLFNVLGISIAEWAFEVPRHVNAQNRLESSKVAAPLTFITCINCKEENTDSDKLLCRKCILNSEKTTTQLMIQKTSKEIDCNNTSIVCRTCCYKYSHNANAVTAGVSDLCISYDCPVFYNRVKIKTYLKSQTYLNIQEALDSVDRW